MLNWNVYKEKVFKKPQGVGLSSNGLRFGSIPSGLRLKSPRVQTILKGQPASEAGVFTNPCEGNALHESEVYPTGMDTWSDPALGGSLS